MRLRLFSEAPHSSSGSPLMLRMPYSSVSAMCQMRPMSRL
jgi:hypothetical protein